MSHDVQNFEKDVIERSRHIPVLVDFWAEWCAPCRMLGPTLERLADKYRGQWELAKVNTEQHQQAAMQYGVQSIPNVKLFINGVVADEFVGALPEDQAEKWLHSALPGKFDTDILQAQNLILNGNLRKAQKMLKPIVKAEPNNHRAAVLLAQACLESDPQQAVELVQNVAPDSEYYAVAESVRTFGKLFHAVKHVKQLPEDPVKDLYLDAIKAMQSGDFESALQNFITVIRKNRNYQEDGARKACIAIFSFLGSDHDLTRQYRSEMSSALY
jgi:putative thioredoxin